MKQQPDKLFREKLEGFNKPVPVSAWNRIESNLDKKNNKGVWLKVAASLLIITTATFLLLPENTVNDSQHLAQNKKEEVFDKKEQKNTISPLLKNEAPAETPIVVLEEKKKATQQSAPKKQNAETSRPFTAAFDKSDKKEVHVAEQEPEQQETEQQPIATTAEAQTSSTEVVAETTSAPRHNAGVTLIYTAEEVNAKYLDKKSLAEATSEDKKPSTLRKLLEKANNLKHNQDPFGELRQKKNEILAFNFKSEKQRGQNK